MNGISRPPQMVSGQGDGEEQTERYVTYREGAPQPATQTGTISTSRAAGFAGRQAGAVRRS